MFGKFKKTKRDFFFQTTSLHRFTQSLHRPQSLYKLLIQNTKEFSKHIFNVCFGVFFCLDELYVFQKNKMKNDMGSSGN